MPLGTLPLLRWRPVQPLNVLNQDPNTLSGEIGLSFVPRKTCDNAKMQLPATQDEHVKELISMVKEKYGGYVGSACHFTGNREDAKDAVQSAFLDAFKGIGTFQGKGKLDNWFRSILRHCAIAISIRERKQGRLNTEDVVKLHIKPRNDNPERQTANTELVTKAMAKLTPEERFLVEAKDLLGMSYEELSEELGLTPDSLKNKRYRINKKLKKVFRETGLDESCLAISDDGGNHE